MTIRNDLLRRIITESGGEVTRQTENGLLQDWLDAVDNPVNYAARLDGVTQYWQLSGGGVQINQGESASFKVLVMNASASAFRYILDSENASARAYLIVSSNNTVTYSPANYRVFVDGVEVPNGGNYPSDEAEHLITIEAIEDVSITTLGARANLANFTAGYFRDLKSSLSEIPLTNKSQGATQLPTVGNISATMANYTEAVWEEV